MQTVFTNVCQYNTVYKYLRKHLLSLKDKVSKVYEYDIYE